MSEPSRQLKGLPELVSELRDLVVAYARQETVEPIKGLGRFVAFGVVGSVMVGIGIVLGLLALLRALQTETGSTFQGDWSWAPYTITAGACVVVISLALVGATRGGRG